MHINSDPLQQNPLGIRMTKLEKAGFLYRPRKVTMEFHISRQARELYGFDESLYSITGNVILPNFLASRVFAKKINDKRKVLNHPEQAVLPGQINAMGLIDEILHYVTDLYRQENGLNIMGACLETLNKSLGASKVTEALFAFSQHFPNIDVYKGKTTPQAFLSGSTDGIGHNELILEEILMLWLANMNPAFGPYNELFSDTFLTENTVYSKIVEGIKAFFDTVKPFGPDNQNLVDMLRSPAIAVPHSLHGQLQYMRERWGMILGKYLLRLLSSLDLMKEEERLFWKGGLRSEGYDSSLSYGSQDNEPERFSPDKEWMPRVLLVAKSTLVWLDQLTTKYGREIKRLDEIPDEELDSLAHRGFNALWFIGLWERSKASKRIKQMCGNPEAEASAYSLYDYDIAWELGGWEAMASLRERAMKRGIRVASDMVPNHTGIDSRWISHHPDWFLQLDYPPFPSYSYNGADLSQDSNIEVKIEDHYFDRSDAAVVFKHRDKNSGRVRYIYHGNDGTSMPWNDTAQLNYLNPEAREAVIQVILHVARNFSIIRFDAAMTLAKKHIQRLWFPIPGSGGDIASRAEHALSKEDFDKAIPEEFWREVVDRVAKEVPDTLLLAEAFWMMEGYFVRTLGMHRVYNSAFMHMFKKEDNEKYRYTIKNTLEFDPDILKRFVNFMNNPDEETAAVQFGTGDKYFGVATMMVTMPGTPMFGHGQVEGFREKYGMEYRKAYWEEKEDTGLIDRHEREIFPLMHKRYLFAEVADFRLFDFWAPGGQVNQNVFAYSNRHGTEAALVVYNNAYQNCIGWIKTSAGYVVKKSDGSKEVRQEDLGSALRLTDNASRFVLMREVNSGLWYIRKSQDLIHSGMYFELGGYQKQVFLDVHEVMDNHEGHFARLHHELNGRGVEDIDEGLKEILLRPLYQSFHDLVNWNTMKDCYGLARSLDSGTSGFWQTMENKITNFVYRAQEFTGGKGDAHKTAASLIASLKSSVLLIQLPHTMSNEKDLKGALAYLDSRIKDPANLPYSFFAKALLGGLGMIVGDTEIEFQSRSLMDDWFLDRKLKRLFVTLGMAKTESYHLVHMAKLMINNQNWVQESTKEADLPRALLEHVFSDEEVRNLSGLNRYEGVLYFNREGFDYTIWWLFALGVQRILRDTPDAKNQIKAIKDLFDVNRKWLTAAEKSEYQVEKLLDQLGKSSKTTPTKETPKAAAKAPAKKAAAKKATPKKSKE